MHEIDDLGGMLPAVERGYPQSRIAEASYEYQQRIENGDQIVVGVNAFTQEEEPAIDLLRMSEAPRQLQSDKLARLRASRDADRVRHCLDAVRTAAADDHCNSMPYILEAVRASATLGEICEALRDVFGGYQESSIL
jgi:methylmalonyl-CoA mutase N-terminal domain/subunit